MEDNRDSSKRPRGIILVGGSGQGLFIGLFLLALGVVLLLDQQGVVPAHRLYHYFWPAVLIFFGLENLAARTSTGRIFGGLLLVAGVLMLLGDLHYIPFHFGFEIIWPLLLIGIGLALVIGRSGGRSRPSAERVRSFADRISQMMTGDVSESSFNYSAILGGVKQRVLSKQFQGGKLFAFWGGFQIDFTDADIEGDFAVIDAVMFMGGGELRIPSNWVVDIRGVAFMGGYTDETIRRPLQPGTIEKRLIIKGAAIMGGLVIKN